MPDNRTKKNRPDHQDPEKLKTLRNLTGEGMMDCKRALYVAEGDLEKACIRLLDGSHNSFSLVNRRFVSSYDTGLELMRKIWFNFSAEDKVWFLTENPVAMHSSLGRHLRNYAEMWKVPHVPQLIDGVDHSPDHPDAISGRVIKDFQAVVQEVYVVAGEGVAFK